MERLRKNPFITGKSGRKGLFQGPGRTREENLFPTAASDEEDVRSPGWAAGSSGHGRYNHRIVRKIALINQKGGVGKTTTTANLGAALALQGRRCVVVDLDPQANLSLHLGTVLEDGKPSSYRVLTSQCSFAEALVETSIPGLRLVPTDIHLSGAELELAAALGRETLLRDALEQWVQEAGDDPCDYLLFDCPPSLGLLSINALSAADEAFLVVQTEFFALQGMSKLLEVIELVKKRMNPVLECTGLIPCLYDSRLRLAREVLGELRSYFPDRVFPTPIGQNIKLAESPGFGKTIFEYAPESAGARDYASLAQQVIGMEDPAPEDPTAEAADRGPATESSVEQNGEGEPLVEVTPTKPPSEAIPLPPSSTPPSATASEPSPEPKQAS